MASNPSRPPGLPRKTFPAAVEVSTDCLVARIFVHHVLQVGSRAGDPVHPYDNELVALSNEVEGVRSSSRPWVEVDFAPAANVGNVGCGCGIQPGCLMSALGLFR